jgi:hypothetical protein
MLYQVQDGDSWNSIAATYTIGGAAYGPALANFNNAPNADPTLNIYWDTNTINIPDNWLTTNAQNSATVGSGVPAPQIGLPATATASTNPLTAGITGLLKSPSGLLAIGIGAYILLNRDKGDATDVGDWEDAE